MNDVAGDDQVFIRSLATRGALGGISAAVADAADLIDAAGFDYVLVETVGVGQSECDIVRLCDTTLVVLTPESGDEIQVAKAGLMEIADVFVINKDDRPGGDRLRAALRAMLDLAHSRQSARGWDAPIVNTVAETGAGVAGLVAAMREHRAHLELRGDLRSRRRERRRERVMQLAAELLAQRLWSPARLASLQRQLDAGGGADPLVIAQSLVDDCLPYDGESPP
jgi:LAO/AO transport system kinase